jgi:hypothetical protein
MEEKDLEEHGAGLGTLLNDVHGRPRSAWTTISNRVSFMRRDPRSWLTPGDQKDMT